MTILTLVPSKLLPGDCQMGLGSEIDRVDTIVLMVYTHLR